MRIAADIDEAGMTCKGELMDFVSDLIYKEMLTKVIETGTYLGTGSTMALINGLTRTGKQFQFYSIECNPIFFRQAKRNVPRLRGVHLVNGLTVSRSDLPLEVSLKGYPDDIIVDHQENEREKLYLSETDFRVPDDALEDCLHSMSYMPDLVVLDSAGHMGWIEFEYLMKRVKGPFYLALDDTNHIKHYKTAQYVRERYEIVFSTEDKFGGLCAYIPLS